MPGTVPGHSMVTIEKGGEMLLILVSNGFAVPKVAFGLSRIIRGEWRNWAFRTGKRKSEFDFG
jgi:hypothetical protein